MPLPGTAAQQTLAPKVRPPGMEMLSKLSFKESSVLILFFPVSGEWQIPFILRNDNGGPHRAQISFPGGKKEDSDADELETALREAQEEVGIDPAEVKILGRLSDLFVPPSNFMVHPVVGYVDHVPRFVPDPKEVQKIMHVPLKELLKQGAWKEKEVISFQGFPIHAPYFDLQGHALWGATAMMLGELIAIVREYDSLSR